MIRRLLAILVLVAALVPGQETRRSQCAQLLDRVGETLSDSPRFQAAMLVDFTLLDDEPAYTLAANLWRESLEVAEPPREAREVLAAIDANYGAPGPKRTLAKKLKRVLDRRDGRVLEHDSFDVPDQIRDFMVIGPFGFWADSFAGFSYPPEKEIRFGGDPCPGYDGPVRWMPYQVSPAAEDADPFELLTPRTGATYALAQIELHEAATLLVVLDSSSSVDLFVDGQRALSIDRRRELHPHKRWVPVAFPAGWHHLLVKTVDSGQGAFQLSLARLDRGPASFGVEAAGALHSVPVKAAGTSPGGAFVAQDFRELGPAPRDRAERLVHAFRTSGYGLPEAGFVEAAPALEEKDLSPGELWLGWRIVDASTHLPENDELARKLDLARRAVAKDPGFAPMVADLARNEAKNDRIEEGLAMLQKGIEACPRSVDLRDAQLELLGSAGFESDRDRALDAALEACPDAPKVLDHELARLEAKHAREAWIEAAKHRVKKNFALRDLALTLAGRLLAVRHERADLDLFRVLVIQRGLHPYDTAFASLEASMRHEDGDLEREKDALAKLAAMQPKDTGALVTLAERARAAGDANTETVCLAEALVRDPDLSDARRLLADLHPPEHDWFKEFGIDTKAFLDKAPGADAYPDSRIVLLLDQIILVIHEDGTAEEEIHQIHRLQDARGKDDLGTVHAYGDVKVVRTILPDGTSLVPNPGGHGGYEMAGLAPGVVVERRYRRFLNHATGHPDNFGGFYFQDTRLTMPFHYSRYVVVAPKKLGLVPVVERFGAEHKTEERGDDVVYTFLLERVPRIQKEAMMPRAEDLAPHVEFKRPDAWERINRRYLDAYEPACRPTPTIAEAAKKAVGDATDPLEQARRLYEFVMETIVSSDGTGWPTQTLLEKSGDRFALYLALVNAAGIPHHLVMARTQEQMSAPVDWKMIADDLFDYPLVRIEPPGKDPVYVAAQHRYVAFGDIRHDLTDAPVFVTSPEGGRIERIPAAPLASAKTFEFSMEAALDAAGVAQGTVRLTLYGWIGARFKEQIERAEKKRLDQLGAQFALGPIGRLGPKQKGAARFKNVTSRTEPLVIEVDAELKQLIRKTGSGGTLEAPFPPLTLARGFVDRKERKLPFVFHQYMIEDDQATIDLDPAWKIEDLPKDFERSGPLGTVAIRRTAQGTKLIFRREISLTPHDIPASGFPDVASFAKDVDEAEARKITLHREPQ